METTRYHLPVLADAVERFASGVRRAADLTVGGGGHAERLRAAGADVLAADRDPEALVAARAQLGDDGMTWVEGRFGGATVLDAVRRFMPELVLLDLGVSSRHLDDDRRGFSFRRGVPLDMRMTPEGPSAADLLNRASSDELQRILRDFADEPRARRIARAIAERREREPLAVSDDLVAAIRRGLGPSSGPADFARIFQAVRIAINDELGELDRALPALRDALVPGGRLLVMTYHSGEDRMVKHAFREWSRECVCPPGQPICTCRGHALGARRPRRPVVPDAAEIATNARARSAKLRVFEVAHAG